MVMGKAGRICLWPEIFSIMKCDDYKVASFISSYSLQIWFITRLTMLKWFSGMGNSVEWYLNVLKAFLLNSNW